jgi:probable HAF family extracellular repeat protein
MNRCGTLVSTLLGLAGTFLASEVLAQQDPDICAAYAQRAVQQYQQMRSHPGCEKGTDPIGWRDDYAYHYNGCMKAPAFLTKFSEKTRDEHLKQCGGDVVASTPTLPPTPTSPLPVSGPSVPTPNSATPASPARPASAGPLNSLPAVPVASPLPPSDAGLQSNYTVRDLTAEAHHGFEPMGMNDDGVVVGRATLPTGNSLLQHGVIFDGTLHALNATASLDPFVANAINDQGQITGRASPGNRPMFYYGTPHALPAPQQGGGEGLGINAAGKVAGSLGITAYMGGSFLTGSDSRGFFYDGTWHDIGGLGGGQVHAVAINDSDQITGFAQTAGGATHAFLYDGKMHDLGSLVPGGSSRGTAINNSGRIVGVASISTGQTHGFYYDGSLHDLGTLGGLYSTATGINAAGLIVGSAGLADGSTTHAFVSNGTKLVDLNTRLVGPHPDVPLMEAIAINRSGQILVRGPGDRAILLTPTSEPLAPTPVCDDSAKLPQGTGGRIEHQGSTATLSFTGACGERRSFLVARPRLMAGVPSAGDSGGWVYSSPDRKTAYMFNLANSGDVSSNALSGPQLQMMTGP